MQKPIHIAVEGNFFSGRSTALEIVEKRFQAPFYIEEPMYFIPDYYENPKRYSYKLLSTILTNLHDEYEKLIFHPKWDNSFFVTENSVLSYLHVFAPVEQRLGRINYQEWKNLEKIALGLSHPDYVLYIDTSPELCYTRVNDQPFFLSEYEQEFFTLEYLEMIDDYQKDLWEKDQTRVQPRNTKALVSRIDGNQAEEAIADAIDRAITKIQTIELEKRLLQQKNQLEKSEIQEQENASNPIHFSIEGNIGSGKTTLLKALKKQIDIPVYTENVENWKYLPKFYEEPKKYAFLLQKEILEDLKEQYKKIQKEVKTDFYFTERSVLSCLYVFAEIQLEMGNITQEEFNELQELARDIPRPDHVFYIHVLPNKLAPRIKKRNRECEKGITLKYLKQLYWKERVYWLKTKTEHKGKPVDIINVGGQTETEVVSQAIEKIQGTLENYIGIPKDQRCLCPFKA